MKFNLNGRKTENCVSFIQAGLGESSEINGVNGEGELGTPDHARGRGPETSPLLYHHRF